MTQVLRPKPLRSMPVWLLSVGVSIVVVAAISQFAFSSALSFRTLVEAFGMIAVASIPVLYLLLNDKKLRSVELSSVGATSLVWQRTSSAPFLHLVSAQISWPDVQRIGIQGALVLIASKSKTIQVNTFLFEEPSAVVSYIKECLARSNSAFEEGRRNSAAPLN